MGNHDAGRAMGLAAQAVLNTKPKLTKKTALKILDDICTPWKDCDAEFESEDPNEPGCVHPDYSSDTDPDGPLGKLIMVAFDGQKAAYDEMAWFDGPYAKFSKRYKFW